MKERIIDAISHLRRCRDNNYVNMSDVNYLLSILEPLGDTMIEWEIGRLIEEKEKELLEAIKKKNWTKAQRLADEIKELKKIKKKIMEPYLVPRPKQDPFIKVLWI